MLIARPTKNENANLYRVDEIGLSNCENYKIGFVEKGHPLLFPMETKRERLNIVSAIANMGHVRFMVYKEKMKQHVHKQTG